MVKVMKDVARNFTRLGAHRRDMRRVRRPRQVAIDNNTKVLV